MLKTTLTNLIKSNRFWQTVLFALFQVVGLTVYAGANNFAAYTTPRLGQLAWLFLCYLLIFQTLYQIVNPSARSQQLDRLWLLLATIVWLIGLLFMPLMVSLLTAITLLTFAVLTWFSKVFLNEWGLLTLSVLLGLNAASFFMINHQYLSVTFLTALLLPVFVYLVFLAPFFNTPFVIWIEGIGAVLCLFAILAVKLSPISILASLVILALWLYLIFKRAVKTSVLAMGSALLTLLILVINR